MWSALLAAAIVLFGLILIFRIIVAPIIKRILLLRIADRHGITVEEAKALIRKKHS